MKTKIIIFLVFFSILSFDLAVTKFLINSIKSIRNEKLINATNLYLKMDKELNLAILAKKMTTKSFIDVKDQLLVLNETIKKRCKDPYLNKLILSTYERKQKLISEVSKNEDLSVYFAENLPNNESIKFLVEKCLE